VTPLAISVAATGVNKVYDGTTSDAPTLSSGGVILGDQVTLAAAAANFASKNVGTAQTVTVSGISTGGADAADYVLNSATAVTTATISPASLTVSGVAAAETLSGAGAGNYVLVQPTGLVASITPATLTYDATPASRTAGQSPTGLSGSLGGFVANETEAADTTGTLAWTTPANAGSRAGQYAIDGGGLTAANYVFVEAPGNATALTLLAAAVPPMPPPIPTPPPAPPVPSVSLPPGALSALAGLQAMMLVSPPAEPPASLDQPVTLIGSAQGVDSGTLGAGGSADVDTMGSTGDTEAPSWRQDPVVADSERRIGTTGVSLRILSGGVRLPP
jgi:hypothetical protein